MTKTRDGKEGKATLGDIHNIYEFVMTANSSDEQKDIRLGELRELMEHEYRIPAPREKRFEQWAEKNRSAHALYRKIIISKKCV
ncbi:hypothetical protein AS030_06480 [Fictibacillus enclensis]|uniref:Uncharacterized protein n=1 Tax=Fictibacillus enclensis TaxID=1017270 RepID=A0A0V8JDC6_9BACL|nr:hypothetical protein [Fictibacillus enclensis]KSU85159.1 hypothetical protein AS030_06480 [Fictibacillus enclensis]